MTRQQMNGADIEQAKRNAAVARSRVQTTVGALKQRLSPSNIAAEAKTKVKERTDAITGAAGDVAKRRPVATGTAAGLATLIVFRKPVGRLAKRLFGRKDKAERVRLKAERARLKAERKAERRAGKDRDEAPGAVAAPPDDLIPHAAVPNAASAKQE
ncbi:MAG TPA: DUF3618 domain-containing protein [Allosphingosinicella sp.]|jgi:hypothetical protein